MTFNRVKKNMLLLAFLYAYESLISPYFFISSMSHSFGWQGERKNQSNCFGFSVGKFIYARPSLHWSKACIQHCPKYKLRHHTTAQTVVFYCLLSSLLSSEIYNRKVKIPFPSAVFFEISKELEVMILNIEASVWSVTKNEMYFLSSISKW